MPSTYSKISQQVLTLLRRGITVPGTDGNTNSRFDLGDICEYKSRCTPTTNPGTPTGDCVYIATTIGTYTHFSGLVIAKEGIHALIYKSGVWSQETLYDKSAHDVAIGLSITNELETLEQTLNSNLESVQSSLNSQLNSMTLSNSVDFQSMNLRLQALEYILPEIITFIHNKGIREVGDEIVEAQIDWTINKSVGTISLYIDDAKQSIDEETTSYLINKDINDTTKLKLEVYDYQNYVSKTIYIYFRHKMHWGTSSKVSLSTEDILTLKENDFATSVAKSATFDCTDGQYIYFAYPKSWGSPSTIKVNGLAVSAWEITEVEHTNASIYTEDYYVYRSTNIQTSSAIEVEIIN